VAELITQEAIPCLLEHITERDYHVSQVVRENLATLGKENGMVMMIIDALAQDPDPWARYNAVVVQQALA
jgi:hypothetical protein